MQKLPFYLFTIGVFLILISPAILSDGMFMDGLMYSTIAHNLAKGIGSFWDLRFTATYLTHFHEHPPLAFGLQSIFFTLFGDSRYIDKLYSLLTFAIVGFLIVKIWNHLGLKNGWLPLLIWFSIPLVSWASSNNMLENTLTIFTSLSVLFYLKYQKQNKLVFILLAGLALSLGFLTKGFVAFFPWSFPFLLWLLMKQVSFRKAIIDTFGIILASIIPLAILLLLSPAAKISLQQYLDIQVVNSLKSIKTVDSRLFIMNRLFSELIPAIVLCVIFVVWGWRKHFSINTLKSNYKFALVFILLGLTGVVPIMISMKQSGFYILATFPFFAVGLGVLLSPLTDYLFDSQFYKTKGFLFFKTVSYFIFLGGIVLSLYFANHIGRDKIQLQDMYVMITKIPEGSTVNILPSMYGDYSLHSYYSRNRNISLDPDLENRREFLLIDNNEFSDTSVVQFYSKIELPTTDYQLYKRNR